MAKIKIVEDFTLEVGDKVYKGTFTDLNKEQKAILKKESKKVKSQMDTLQKLTARVEAVERRVSILEKLEKWDEVLELEKEKEKLTEEQAKLIETIEENDGIESIFKKRLELSIQSDEKEDILQLGKQYGYQNVFNTILEDVEENRKKK